MKPLKPNFLNTPLTILSLFGLYVLKAGHTCTGAIPPEYGSTPAPPFPRCFANYIDTWTYVVVGVLVYFVFSFVYLKFWKRRKK